MDVQINQYAKMGAFGRVSAFFEERPADFFKALATLASLYISAGDPKGDFLDYLSDAGRTGKLFGEATDVTQLPSGVNELLARGAELDFQSLSDILKVASVVVGLTKVAQLGQATKLWNLGNGRMPIELLKSGAGAIVCGILARNDYGGIQAPRHLETTPEYETEAQENINRAKMVGLAKNIARFALNILAFAGLSFGIVTWSPIILSLVVIGITGSIVGFFLKQNAEIIRATGYKMQCSIMKDERDSLENRFKAACNVIHSKAFEEDSRAQRDVGKFLAKEELEPYLNEVYPKVYTASGKSGDDDAQYGKFAVENGFCIKDKGVIDAIQAAYKRFKEAHSSAT